MVRDMIGPGVQGPIDRQPAGEILTAQTILAELDAAATLDAQHADRAPAPPVPAEVVSLVRLADVHPERIDWLWPGYLARGKLHVIDGDPGLGKSTLTTDLAARVTTGANWPDGQVGCAPSGVILLSAEDGLADTIRPRLDAAGADVQRAVALTGIRYLDPDAGEVLERMPALPSDISRIRYAVEQADAALVVIDPLMAYLVSCNPDCFTWRCCRQVS
jgi:RecA-family ATPase